MLLLPASGACLDITVKRDVCSGHPTSLQEEDNSQKVIHQGGRSILWQSDSSRLACRRNTFFPHWSPWLQSLIMSLALGPVAQGRALHSRWGLLLLPAWGAFLHPRVGVLALPEEDNSALRNLSRFWNLFFWSGLEQDQHLKKNNNPRHMWSIIVSEHLFSALCFYSDVCSSLVWSDQQVSDFRNLSREKTWLKSLCAPPRNAPGFEGMVLFSKSKFSRNALTTSRLFSVAPGITGKTETSWQNYTIEIAGRRAQFNTH